MLGFMRGRMLQAAAWSLGLVGFGTAGSAHAALEIDFMDTANFNKKNEIVFFLDLLRDDESRSVYREQDPGGDGFKIQIDGEEVQGAWGVQTFREANQAMSVGVLMSAPESYALLKDIGVIEEEKKGFKAFFAKLSDQDRVMAKTYNDKTLETISAWTNNPSEVTGKIDALVKPADEDPENNVDPRLFAHITKMLEEFEADTEAPRRKILVIMTDGNDAISGDPAKVEKKVGEIVERAKTIGVKIYIVSAQDGGRMDLSGVLQTLASKTGGVYREWWKSSEGPLSAAIEELGAELANQYVATFKPAEYRGSESPVEVLLEVTPTKGGPAMKRKLEKQKIPLRDTDWGGILKLVGMGVGGLLGVILLFFGIRALVRRAGNKAAPVQQEESFAGPYKARLLATAGPYAGREFFITEEVTTIGSLAGNAVVLAEGGVSKRHAGVKVEDMRFELADFGSTNGTYVNGAKITKQFLKDGDEIRLGDNKLRFSLK